MAACNPATPSRLSAPARSGLAAPRTAQLYAPAEIITIDLDDNRLEVATRFGVTATVNSSNGRTMDNIMKLTGRVGVDTAIEAVGISATFELCARIVAPGGVSANVGVHRVKVALHREDLWHRNITITTRLVDTVSTPMPLKSEGAPHRTEAADHALLQAGRHPRSL